MISTVEKVLFLKSIDLFSQISGEDLARIALITEEVESEKGETFIRQGDVGDSLYLIVEGRVKVHIDEREIAQIGERESVGEQAILDSEPRSASVTALTDIIALRIQREDFAELLLEKSEIALGIIKVLSRRLRTQSAHNRQLLTQIQQQTPQNSSSPK